MRECGQRYGVAAAAIFFYDFLLTLADEVIHAISSSLRWVR